MKKIVIQKKEEYSIIPDISILSGVMDLMEKHHLEYTPWKEFGYKPDVSFTICYTATHILLKFFIKEKEIRATITQSNGNVWEDSCVEFFIGSDNDQNYYNLEFNCLGTVFASYGHTNQKRTLLPEGNIKKITTRSVIKREDDLFVWDLTLEIPFSIFIFNPILSDPGTECKVNFYKCGDLHRVPHFVSWNNIHSSTPNFHMPDFFGMLRFH